jgi:flagellar basal body P-ring formation protein FlgA
MIRILALILAALLALAPTALAQALKPAVTIDANVVRLGDIFADAGDRASDPVVAAPPLGTRITYDADWLAATAREHDLDWQPSSPYDQVTIVRATRTIDSDAVQAQLLHEIGGRVSLDGADFRLDNPALSLLVPASAPATVAIDGLSIDQRSGRVTASVSAPAGDPAAQRRTVTGRLIYHVTLPVLNHAVGPGAVIAASDLDTLKVERTQVAADMATDAQQLIGKSPRRPLEGGVPVRLGDLQLPVLVHKGDLVTIELRTDSLELSAQGSALEDGAGGVLVRVSNTKSNRVIDATVTGPDTVAVSLPGSPAPDQTAQR